MLALRRDGARARSSRRGQHRTPLFRGRLRGPRQVTLELTAAIDVGDAAYRRLRLRLDKHGTRLHAVHARLYRDPNALG